MGKQRYVSTDIWDEGWFQEIGPSEKLFYIYLLTNTVTNIAGVYQISDRRIEFDTGIHRDDIKKMWIQFEEIKQAYRLDDWLIIPSWPSKQKWKERSKIKIGIDKILNELPTKISTQLKSLGYEYPIDTLSVPYQYAPDYSNLEKDIDIEKEEDIERRSGARPSFPNPEMATKSRDPGTRENIIAWFIKNYGRTFPNDGRNLTAIHSIIEKSELLSKDLDPPEPPWVVIESILTTFKKLKTNDRSEKGFWRKMPLLPHDLVIHWDRVLEAVREETQALKAENYLKEFKW
jgi:hypothetical protein